MKTIILSLLFCVAITEINAQWKIQNPKPTNENLNSVQFFDSQNGWIASSRSLFQTIDGGSSWNEKKTWEWTSANPSVFFTDFLHGWVAGYGSLLSYTSDGGTTWNPIYFNTGIRDFSINRIFFTDIENGWIIGYGGAQHDSSAIVHTSDGGLNWDVQYLNYGPHFFYGIYFVDSLTGWVTGSDSQILHTTDGGDTWAIQTAPMADIDCMDVFFLDPSTGWIAGYNPFGAKEGIVMLTDDGGATWQIQHSVPDEFYSSVFFTDNLEGWLTGHKKGLKSGLIFHTGDGGQSWTEVAADSLEYLKMSDSPDNINFWAVGDRGSIMSSSDGGHNWHHLDKRIYLNNDEWDEIFISFPDSLHGWVAVSDSQLMHTDNGGALWTAQMTTDRKFFNSVSFPDSLNGWAVAFDSSYTGWIIHSSDGGKTWPYQDTVSNYPKIVFFIDSLTGWIGGFYGSILRTNDGGTTWALQRPDTFGIYLNRIQFVDRLHGWAAGDNFSGQYRSVVLRTENGGENWIISYPGFYEITGLSFTDENNGWITGDDDTYKTNDGGKTWTKVQMLHCDTRDVCAIDSLNAYVLSWYGDVYHTTDGGDNWESQFATNYQYASSIMAVDSLNVWVAGTYGLIAHTDNGGDFPVGGVPPEENEVQQTSDRISVFPNPADDHLYIDLSEETCGTISVADLQGRELLRQGIESGTVCLKVHTLNQGIYFLRILTPERSSVVKFIKK